MQKAASKITKFTDLKTWQSAHSLMLDVYKHTKSFPDDEQFGLIAQLRRASVSVASCIAEGFSRRTAKDKVHFYSMAQGSLTEVQDQLLLSRDLRYINHKEFSKIAEKSIATHKLISGLIKSIKNNNA